MKNWIKLTDETCPNRGIEVFAKKGNKHIFGEIEGDEETGFTCEGETGSIYGVTHFAIKEQSKDWIEDSREILTRCAMYIENGDTLPATACIEQVLNLLEIQKTK